MGAEQAGCRSMKPARWIAVALLAIGITATADASRPATSSEAAAISDVYNGSAACSTVRVSTIDKRYARWDYREPYPKDCTLNRGNGFGIANLVTGEWGNVYGASDSSVACSTVKGVPARVAAELKACTRYRAKKCSPLKNVYRHPVRYRGLSLYSIRASGVSCRTARSVARGSNSRGIAGGPGYYWHDWFVTVRVKGSHRYTATRRGRTVRWQFGI